MKVTVLGGGPSLTKTQRLEGPFIGCNMAILRWPCQWGVWIDRSWWTKWGKDIPESTQQWSSRDGYPPHVNRLESPVKNTGALGIQLAMHLGFSEIYLAGFDFSCVDGKANWHNHYTRRTQSPQFYVDNWYVDFLWIKEKADELSVHIINLNPESKLTLFPCSK